MAQAEKSLLKAQDGHKLPGNEVYRALVRSLRRRKGFGIVFVQCVPVEAEKLTPRLQADIPKKRIERLKLEEPIDNLYELVDDYNLLCN